MIIQEFDLCHKTANQLKERKPMHIFIPFNWNLCVNNNDNPVNMHVHIGSPCFRCWTCIEKTKFYRL